MAKLTKRLLAAGLCSSAFFSLYGCGATPDEKGDPVDPAPVASTQEELAGTLVTTAANGQIMLVRSAPGPGTTTIDCPPGLVALGGGARCTNGELNVTGPILGNVDGETLPTGWREWHRGSSSNDCKAYAICAPATWFAQGELVVRTNSTGYGQGSVACPPNFKTTGGGSFCTDGDLDLARPNPALTGYDEWHRGASSNDCTVSAVCVANTNWLARSIYFTNTPTGYGSGNTNCSAGDIALGGGSFCTNGDADFDFPQESLAGWSEWHRGASSNDCEVEGVCLRTAAVNRVAPGMACNGTTGIFDCDNKCVDKATALQWKTDTFCDDGRFGMDLVCSQFDFDNHTCG